jgi:hypothetical protein
VTTTTKRLETFCTLIHNKQKWCYIYEGGGGTVSKVQGLVHRLCFQHNVHIIQVTCTAHI